MKDLIESSRNLLARAILTKCNQCAINGWWWKNKAKAKGKWLWMTFTQWSIRLITNILYQGDICMTDSNRGWRCLTDGWSIWVCFPQTLASFPLQLRCNMGQPLKAGALEAFWAPVLTKTQSFLTSLTPWPYGDHWAKHYTKSECSSFDH